MGQLNFFSAHAVFFALALLACYLVTQLRHLWYAAVVLFFLNAGLLVMYLAVDSMTGEGFNEAAMYYLLQADWRDARKLLAYDAVVYGVPALLMIGVVCTWLARAAPLPGFLKLTPVSQLVLILGTGFVGFFLNPMVSDVDFVIRSSGLDKQDRIGLSALVRQADAAEVIKGPHKNLIVLYAESLEAAFFEAETFPGLMPRLNELMARGVRFDKIGQSPMSDWTIAGMIATQCGVPLSSHRLQNKENDFDRFSTGYQCLSQHLAKQGYARVYMGGASNGFAGKGDYYRSMGFDEVLGLEELASSGSPQSRWGLYDDELLPLLAAKIRALRDQGSRPFALFALTLDTHPPTGFPSPSCSHRGIRYDAVQGLHFDTLRCTDELLADFLGRTIEENLHDSTIVLLSDHVMMNSQALDALKSRRVQRMNHMVIWDRDLTPGRIQRTASQFDVAPTLLHVLLGRSYQLGFGFSMLDSRQNLTEQYGRDVFDEAVHAWRTESWKKW